MTTKPLKKMFSATGYLKNKNKKKRDKILERGTKREAKKEGKSHVH